MTDSEIEFQEQLIQEREGEIEEIEQGITELNEIFRDLATIVSDQGSMISESSLPSIRSILTKWCRQHRIERYLGRQQYEGSFGRISDGE